MPSLSRILQNIRIKLIQRNDPSLESEPLPEIAPEKARAVVVAFYMNNIRRGVVVAQRRVLKRFVPANMAILQIETKLKHGKAIERFLATTPYKTVVFLDIDCVPIREGALERLVARAEAGALAGAAFRANHLENGAHLFAGPFCMALQTALYRRLGQPSCMPTPRGDAAEELTYAAEAAHVPVDFLWPTSSEDDKWELRDGRRYGHGTVYEHDFWHAFEIRLPHHHRAFINKCAAFLASAGPRSAA